jgi:hypothetical protein
MTTQAKALRFRIQVLAEELASCTTKAMRHCVKAAIIDAELTELES